MIRKITPILVSTLMVIAAVVAPAALLSSPANAIDPSREALKGYRAAGGDNSSDNQLPTVIETVVNLLLFVVGAVAVIMIVIGGIRYVTSNGDSTQITSAKNTVLYSVIGLIIALVAYAVVRFVILRF